MSKEGSFPSVCFLFCCLKKLQRKSLFLWTRAVGDCYEGFFGVPIALEGLMGVKKNHYIFGEVVGGVRWIT